MLMQLHIAMAFTFNFASSSAGRKSSFPFSSSASAVPRPASLLQRGRSFTSEDFAKTFQMSGLADAEEVIADHDESSGTSSPSQAEMQRSASSPTSSFSCSPPSSISSLAMSEESDRLEPETDIEPVEESKRFVQYFERNYSRWEWVSDSGYHLDCRLSIGYFPHRHIEDSSINDLERLPHSSIRSALPRWSIPFDLSHTIVVVVFFLHLHLELDFKTRNQTVDQTSPAFPVFFRSVRHQCCISSFK